MITIQIDPSKSIETLREPFRLTFPFLNLECFSSPHGSGKGNQKKNILPPETRLSNCMSAKKEVTLEIDPGMTVHELEQRFAEEAGMNVQVFRRSGKLWLETTTTDAWTLEMQNEEGKKSTEDIREEIDNPDDHDIY